MSLHIDIHFTPHLPNVPFDWEKDKWEGKIYYTLSIRLVVHRTSTKDHLYI